MARILILTHEFPPFRGGIAAVAHGLATGAAAIGHEPIVLAPDYHTPPSGLPTDPRYRVIRFPGATCPIVSFRRLVRFARVCDRAIRELKPDIIHAADPPAQMAVTALGRLGRVPAYYFTVHGTEALRYAGESLPRLWMWRAFQRVERVAAVSHAVLSLLVEKLGLPPERGLVAYPAIAAVWHELPAADRRMVRQGWGAGADDVVLLTTARVVPDKGHADVLAAAGRLPPGVRERLVYVVVGTGPAEYAQRLDDMAAAAGVRLRRLGEVNDHAAVHACDGADVFVMPSRQTATRLEGFGIAYLEAAARGVPSLARATGGAGEAVLHGETGIVLPGSADAQELATALHQLIAEPAKRAELGRAARAHARGFTWENHARTVYSAFRSERVHL